ncbi:MAG: hypothetical protein PHC61_00530 [Chitinivibrionales bacterium]|nr:hypothetical protein [Chitinivibrionales bacterium]
MKHIYLLLTLLLMSIFFAGNSSAERLIGVQIGPGWPADCGGRPAWDLSAQYGILVDRIVGLGLSADFLWNTSSQTSPISPGSNQYRVLKNESHLMFPVCAFAMVDPLPVLLVHPVVTAAIGYNPMVFTKENYDSSSSSQTLKSDSSNGYYQGLIVKLIADAQYNVGERAALFLGLGYIWAQTSKGSGNVNVFLRDMSTTTIHAGIRILL